MTTLWEILYLKGHGIYVWPAYGLVIGLLAVQVFLPWRRLRKLHKKHQGTHAQIP